MLMQLELLGSPYTLLDGRGAGATGTSTPARSSPYTLLDGRVAERVAQVRVALK